MKHTPTPWATDGRWIVQEVDGCSFWPDQPFIADCAVSSSYRETGTTEGNAQLIVESVNKAEAADALAVAVREFLADWRKGDFKLPKLAECDALAMEDKLKEYFAKAGK